MNLSALEPTYELTCPCLQFISTDGSVVPLLVRISRPFMSYGNFYTKQIKNTEIELLTILDSFFFFLNSLIYQVGFFVHTCNM